MLEDMSRTNLPKLTGAEAELMLKEYRDGANLYDLLKRYKISETTFYRWKMKWDGLTSKEIQSGRKLEKKNKCLERKVKDLEQEVRALRSALRKKF